MSSSKRTVAAVILAAGRGSRMRSKKSKLLHTVTGRPIISYPVQLAIDVGAQRIVIVVGHQRDEVEAILKRDFPKAPLEFVVQSEQRGTGHAVSCARNALEDFDGDVLILSGDVPCLTNALLARLLERQTQTLSLVTMKVALPNQYGRLLRDDEGRAKRIVEYRDATPEQRELEELNAGIYCASARFLFDSLKKLTPDNAQGEFYLTDLVQIAHEQKEPAGVVALSLDESVVTLGVNDRQDLAKVEEIIRARVVNELMLGGVTVRSPKRTIVGSSVTIGEDSVLEADVTIRGHTHIGADVTVGQGSVIENSQIGDGVSILPYCHIANAIIGAGCSVGPFARLREGSVLRENVKVGNFVETKKTTLKAGAKASHLSYLGDATVGEKANIGAGTITCNYDGYKKSKTVIGPGAFIGSDTQLVAPVEVGAGAVVGAGTTVTQNIPADALAVSRVEQKHVEGWAARKREREAQAKKDS